MDAIKSLKILVTGANGQLGRSILDVSKDFPQFEYHFKTSKDLDITDFDRVKELFNKEEFDYCINCAAYTAVDKAESEKEKAFMINAEAVGNLAEVCSAYNVILLHISTDFVFDGTKTSPYTEEDEPNPINVYGASKLKGERYIQELLKKYFIIRTSWVYSEYGHNFVKTMLRLARERDEISVVSDQIGSPTYARDLAIILIKIITTASDKYGLYHYSNEGGISWYDFAKAIFEITGNNVHVNAITSEAYVTNARRPFFSVMANNKINYKLNLEIHSWKKILMSHLTI
ncbi:MAG: dTDP-4-dehydrorhamnose reductase [Sediminicola sp.]